jgi:hypothetical protein
MRYCKIKTTGQVIETQSGDGDLEMFYSNNSEQYSRDELEVGIAEDNVVDGWLQEQHEASRTYADKRQQEYPPMADYLDGIVKGDKKQINQYVDDCLAVKQKYPKP